MNPNNHDLSDNSYLARPNSWYICNNDIDAIRLLLLCIFIEMHNVFVLVTPDLS